MSWLRGLFGLASAKPRPPAHIGILVRGTLLNANMAAAELKMLGLDQAPHIKGVAPLFGIGDGLRAERRNDEWVEPRHLDPPWLLVIPEDAHAAFRYEFERDLGKPVDGRVESAGAFSIVNISRPAREQVSQIIASWGPAAAAYKSGAAVRPGRVEVGSCSACGRPLKVKVGAVRPTMKLTCKCGAANIVATGASTAGEPAAPD